MELVKVTANGEQHGLINQLPNSVRDDGFKHMEPKKREEAKKQKAEDCRMVKARYVNYRNPHERLEAPYMDWAGEPIRLYKLISGEEYDLPLGFVNKVNGSRLNKRSKEDGPNDTPAKVEGQERIHELLPVGF